jgi:hypothetical protein
MAALDPKLSMLVHMRVITSRHPHVSGILTDYTGSNVIVAGTAIFGSPNAEEVIALLKSTVDTAQAKIVNK